MTLFDREPLYHELEECGLASWSKQLRSLCAQKYAPTSHGDFEKWRSAIDSLPNLRCEFNAHTAAIQVSSPTKIDGSPSTEEIEALRHQLMQLHPWRKGPFQLFGLYIDTEWRSDLKWTRMEQSIDFNHKKVLDVGCGNGYYGWKILNSGAELVIGCDPTLLYNFQFEVFRRYAPTILKHYLIPVADHELPSGLACFDVTISMGVLYHRTSPIDHLLKLAETLKTDGTLLIETLILDSQDETQVLMPLDRYAKMRNVWFIPTIKMLKRWLHKTGFTEIEVTNISPTTTQEQRGTDWMQFESLNDFLDPNDLSKTIEGYPAPLRGMLKAKKK